MTRESLTALIAWNSAKTHTMVIAVLISSSAFCGMLAAVLIMQHGGTLPGGMRCY